MRDSATESIRSSDRGISDVIGYVLVVSLVVSVVALVSVSGFASLGDARDAEQANNAERAFDVLSDNVADVYEDGAPSRATEISLADASLQTTSTVVINVSANDTDTNDNFTFERSSRAVVWEGNRDTQIAYSLGATLRDERDGGVVINRPPFRLDPERTVIHIVLLRQREGQSFGEGTVRVRMEGISSRALLTDETGTYNQVWLNITTPRAAIWRQHLDRYPDASCTTVSGGASETVACNLTDRDEVHVALSRINVEVEG